MSNYNDNQQPVICVPYAYGGGVVTLTACSTCGAVVIGESNIIRHNSWHNDVDAILKEYKTKKEWGL